MLTSNINFNMKSVTKRTRGINQLSMQFQRLHFALNVESVRRLKVVTFFQLQIFKSHNAISKMSFSVRR